VYTVALGAPLGNAFGLWLMSHDSVIVLGNRTLRLALLPGFALSAISDAESLV
jgi:hypothetical protein